jgi:hypothetical protein
MKTKRLGIGKRLVFYLASLRASDEAPRLGDLMDALGLRTGTATGERLREYRQRHGCEINCDLKTYRYEMSMKQRREIRKTDEYKKWKRGLPTPA